MLEDARQGLFDLLVTKEVSRFSRNILDTVTWTRALKADGIGVCFINDGISTLDDDAELRLSIMASIAQEESRKTSERVKWGQRRQMERGVVFGRSLLGYTVKNGVLTVEPAGAALVRRIFAMYVDDRLSAAAIARALTGEGIPTMTGSPVWSSATVLKILKNEKYCGDLTQGKTVTVDYLTHKKTPNRDAAQMVHIPGHHEPVVSRQLWEQAQAERQRRTPAAAPVSPPGGNRYALSGKIRCGGCGAVYLCRTRRRKGGAAYRVWSAGRCPCGQSAGQLREDDVARCVRAAVAATNPSDVLGGLVAALEEAGREGAAICALDREHAKLREKGDRLLEAYLAGDIDRVAFKGAWARIAEAVARCDERRRAQSQADAHGGEIAYVLRELAAGQDADDDFYLRLVDAVRVEGPGALVIGMREQPGLWRVARP